MHRLAAFAVILSTLLAAPALAQRFTVERAEEWTDLFDRRSGWTGADGIYSIPLDGDDRYRRSASRPTAFVFSDTFIGPVDHNGRRLQGTTMVNNTMALLRGSEPDHSRINFKSGRDAQNRPAALFIPDTPNSRPDDWYWLGDGIALNGKFYNLAARMERTGNGMWDFALAGRSMISIPLNVPDPFSHVEQVETPFTVLEPSGDRGPMEFGVAFMNNTAEAGAPHPDGYVYIYGIQNDPWIKKLLVARVVPEQLEEFDAWRFWDGEQWQEDIEQSAVLTGRVSSECSVTPLPDGRFLLVYQEDTLGPWVAVKVGESPVGPFGPGRRIWYCDEVDTIPDAFVYNAKAHPHLSKPGELLISYNVNNLDFWNHFRYASSYRPRFIRLRIE